MALEWQKFTNVFQAKPDYTLDSRQVDGINRHRKELGGALFFDRVCASVGLKQGKTVTASAPIRTLTSRSSKVLSSEIQ